MNALDDEFFSLVVISFKIALNERTNLNTEEQQNKKTTRQIARYV